MMNARRDNKTNKLLNIVLTLVVIGLVLVLLLLTPLFSWFSRGSHRAGVGLWQAREQVAEVASTTKSLVTASKKELLAENKALRTELDEYKGRLLVLQQLRAENDDLRAQLNVTEQESEFVTARVLVRPAQSTYNTLVVYAGSDDGVSQGDLVTVYGTATLGRVVEVFPKTSKVALFSSPDVKTNVVLASEGVTLEATGRGAGNMRLELPRDIDVENGAQLLDGQGRIVGVVRATMFDPREPFQTVIARSAINVRHLDWVQVMVGDTN
jgi:rod shape-determining protein MreC